MAQLDKAELYNDTTTVSLLHQQSNREKTEWVLKYVPAPTCLRAVTLKSNVKAASATAAAIHTAATAVEGHLAANR